MPNDILTFVNRLYSKFDQLCDHYGIYKLDTIGDHYTAMGYTGKRFNYKRTEEDILEEATKTLLVAFQMIEVVSEEKKR